MASTLILFVSAIILSLSNESACEYLRIVENKFLYGDQQIFLSGVNIAWHNYGTDFGNANYNISRPILEEYIRGIKSAGGNALRIWIHVEGADTPQFDSNGYVTAPDSQGNFINDLSIFLDYAEENNVFVIPVLWNGAVMRDERYIGMLFDDSKLESFINNSLKPVVRSLRNKGALAAWEIVNEPEGSVAIESNENPCFDTIKIGQGGAGWTGVGVPMKRFLSFINRQNAAIRAEDPKALITAGSWSERSQNSAFSDSFNHYSDECLRAAGGEETGIIDFYQIHTYSWEGRWSSNAPILKNANDYLLDKPLVIGEFSADCAENEGVEYLWSYIYNNSYSGAWSWQYNAGGGCSDTRAAQNQGMSHIRNFTHNGHIPVHISSSGSTLNIISWCLLISSYLVSHTLLGLLRTVKEAI